MTIYWMWKALYYSWLLTEVLVLVVTRTRRGGGNVQDRGSLMVLWVVIFGAMFVGSWAGAVVQPARFHTPPWFAEVCLGLLALGLVIRWTAIYTLGKAFSANVAIHATQRLNVSGVFRWMRHPSYTGMMLIFLAMPAAALLYRIHVEEDALTGAFGDEYVEYSRTTKRLIPGIY
jgi:protein-S-isoprenylcysteine O-methyltransferase Ste14